MSLKEFFKQNPKAALGFSGGTDSAYLLYAGAESGADVKPYFVKTAFQPEFELRDAESLCRKLGTEIKIIELDLLESRAAENPPDRCYHCKRAMFTALKAAAEEDGCGLIIDGTNASDDLSARPGAKALAELGVRSPLRECGLTKEEIRRLSKDAGLFTWNKPSYSCLATRFPQGERITAENLFRIEKGEAALMELGFSDFRLYVRGKAARLRLKEEQLAKAVEARREILMALSPYFEAALLDLETR